MIDLNMELFEVSNLVFFALSLRIELTHRVLVLSQMSL